MSIPITADRLPAWARDLAPEGLQGEALADWYLTLELGRSIGQQAPLATAAEMRAGLGEVLRRVGDLAGLLMALRLPGPQGPADMRMGPKPARAPAPDPFDPDLARLAPMTAADARELQSAEAFPDPPPAATVEDIDMTIALPPADYEAMQQFAHRVVAASAPSPASPEATAAATERVVRRLALGFHGTPGQGGGRKGPPWRSLPSRGWQQIVVAALGRAGVIPEVKADSSEA